MKAALAALASRAGSWDAVVWAGVGHGVELEAVRALGGRQCYVEPHPGLRRRIEARLGSADGVSVEARPLWSTDGLRVFHLANDAVSSTLRPPAEAWAGRPNVRVVEDVEVETRSLATLFDDLSLDEDATALLILDIGGGEEELLFAGGELILRGFDQVLLPARSERAASRLQELGCDRETFADGWCLLGRARPASPDLGLEVEQLSAQLAARSAQRDELARAFEQADRDLEALREAHAKLAAERDESEAARAAVTRERDEHAETAASLQERLAALESASAEAAARLQGERDAADARATTLQQKLTDFSKEAAGTIAALTAERDTAIGSLAQKTALAERLQAERDQARERADRLDAELAEARRTAALSLKLQAQRDADLADLQQRYRESQDIQERQRQLLERLGERLGVASRYFHQLADERGQE